MGWFWNTVSEADRAQHLKGIDTCMKLGYHREQTQNNWLENALYSRNGIAVLPDRLKSSEGASSGFFINLSAGKRRSPVYGYSAIWKKSIVNISSFFLRILDFFWLLESFRVGDAPETGCSVNDAVCDLNVACSRGKTAIPAPVLSGKHAVRHDSLLIYLQKKHYRAYPARQGWKILRIHKFNVRKPEPSFLLN